MKESTDTKSTYHHGDLKGELLRAAIELVSEGGPDALTMRALSRRVGVSHAAPYRHFADRRELLSAVARQGFAGLRRYTLEAGARAHDPVERFEKMALAYVDFAIRNPAHYSLMFGREVLTHPVSEELRAAARSTLSEAVSVIQACQTSGRVLKGDAQALTDVVWATLHGLATLSIEGLARAGSAAQPAHTLISGVASQTFDAASDLARRAVRTLVRGIAADPSLIDRNPGDHTSSVITR